MSQLVPILNAIMRVDNLPDEGRSLKVMADKKQLEKIANYLQIEEVREFSAEINVSPIKDGFIVRGKMQATIMQPSVISLAPVIQQIEEKLERIFLFGQEPEFKESAESEIFIDLEGDDLPDYYNDVEVDFDGFFLENLALAIDPFPKNSGEKFEFINEDEDKEKNSPFSKLRDLKFNQ